MSFAPSKFYCFYKIDAGEIGETCVVKGKGEGQCTYKVLDGKSGV
jgi:hypothetical protein